MYLTQALHRSVRQTPDEPATIDGDRVRTVAEHVDRVALLAGGLRNLGVSDGERVAILASNSDRYVELLSAVPWANGILNPINTRWSPGEIVYSMVDSDSGILVVDDAFAPLVPDLKAGHPGLRKVIHAGAGKAPERALSYEDLLSASVPVPDARRGGDEVAAILYTGGTTGRPKGVMVTHANLLVSMLGMAATSQLGPGGRMLQVAPLFHMSGLATWLTQAHLGGALVLVPAFDPVAVMTMIQQHRATAVLLVPTMLKMLVDHPELPNFDLGSLATVLYGASPMSEAPLRRAMDALPHAEFVQAYGMTEVGVATWLTGEDHRRGDRLGSIGRAAVHAEVQVVDSDDNEVPRGTVGEVVVWGGHMMAGYWAKPDETAATVRDGWMHTGDAGYMDEDGYIFLVDRIKDMIITGGENVYSVEVENALSQHPAVAMCGVVGIPDDTWGERVHAVVVLQPGAAATADELRDHARGLLAGYKVPSSIEFVDAIPLSGAGKVLKRELRARLADDPGGRARGGGLEPPTFSSKG